MSLKAELETWAAALKAYDEEDFEKSLDQFGRIADSSKILTNMGLIYATLGEHEMAVEQFNAATSLDQYLAVAYFQCGVSNFLLGRYDLALHDFDDALLYLRGNQNINYEQLGLKFKLYSAEVLFNKGLSQIYLGRVEEGLIDMAEGQREKATEEHNVIDDAIQDRGEGYTVFSIPVGILYRPAEAKLRNAKTKDYLGKAKLVAADDISEAYTTFTGVTRLQRGQTPTGALIDPPTTDSSPALARSATVPPPRDPVGGIDRPRVNLERARTTLNVPGNARERTAGVQVAAATSVARSNTTTATNRIAAPPVGTARGLSIRRPGGPGAASSASPPAPTPPPEVSKPLAPGLTEIYDDYMTGYEEEGSRSGRPSQRVAAWAKANGAPSANVSRASSVQDRSAYAPSSPGTLRRKNTRRPTAPAPNRVMSTYEEEEEGYVSGEYDEVAFRLSKIRVKIHYEDDVRGMTLTPETPFEEFMDRLTSKFDRAIDGLSLKFKDEDGGKVTLRDESDYELAIETAREMAKGKTEGKLEIWAADI